MKSKSFWQRIGFHDWFLSGGEPAAGAPKSLTPDDVYHYIVEKFTESVRELSFAQRVVFYHEYIIAFNTEDYRSFIENRKGLFGLIVQESVRKFYELLSGFRQGGKTVEPSASKWVFRFVSHPDYGPGDLGFIGKLLPGASQKEENLRVTFIPRQTGIAQTADVSEEILRGFTFYSEGYYEVPYLESLKAGSGAAGGSLLARFEAILPDKAYAGKKLEYLMRDEEIVVSGKDDPREASNLFRLPSEWIDTPHLRIRYDRGEDQFYVASFGEKTVLNEKEIRRSDPKNPAWQQLPLNSRLVLNGIVGINLYKS